MAGGRGRGRGAAAAAALLLLVGACGGTPSATRRGASPVTTTTVRYGSGVHVAGASTTTAPGATGAPDGSTDGPAGGATADAAPTTTAPPATAVDLTVVDPAGHARPGVRMVVQPVTGATVRLTSGPDGHVRRELAPGRYHVTVPEACGGQLHVLRGGSADLGVVDGQTTKGRLVAEVEPRYRVTAPVTYDGDAGWRVGEVHAVRFHLTDACGGGTGDVPGPRAYGAVVFAAAEGVEVVTPLDDGVGPGGAVHVDLRCTAADVDVAVAMVDALDPQRRTEVLTTALMPDQHPPFCLAAG
jgi:hypothetical protein